MESKASAFWPFYYLVSEAAAKNEATAAAAMDALC